MDTTTKRLAEHFPTETAGGSGYCLCEYEFASFEDWADHALAFTGVSEPPSRPWRAVALWLVVVAVLASWVAFAVWIVSTPTWGMG